jgi:sugar phosphate isomerase/epimerase
MTGRAENDRMTTAFLTRREMLGVTSTLLAAPLPGAEAGSGFRLRYFLASCMYGTLPLAEILPEVAKAGADGIDLWPKVHGSQRDEAEALGPAALEALLASHNVRLAMTTRYDLGPFRLAEEIEFVRRLGGKLIVTGSRRRGSGDLKADVESFVRELEPHVAIAEKAGIVIAIENHSNALIESPDSLRYLAEMAKSPSLGVALAPYHLPQNPSLQAQLVKDLGPKLVHFYAWEHGRGCHMAMPKADELQQLPGYGSFDFVPVVRALRDIQYRGAIEIFMHPTPRGIPILPTVAEVTGAINRSRQALERGLTA